MTQFTAWPVGAGVWVGPVRQASNSSAHQRGSIHDDATAQKLGFRGGTVAASLHMEQFPPLLVHLLGPRWWQSGGLSLYFRYATRHLEPVQCHAVAPLRCSDDMRIEVWMDHPRPGTNAAERVADGTASVGRPDETSALRQRLQLVPEPEDLRILAGLSKDASCCDVATRISQSALDERLGVITEPLPEYTTSNSWGRPVMPPSLMVRAMRTVESALLERTDPAVGLFGAIEVQHLRGPLFIETDYVARGRVIAVGETPKTEFFWYETTLTDCAEGTDVASMLMMLRFMKASSPRWTSSDQEFDDAAADNRS
jgi:hypothetical protein